MTAYGRRGRERPGRRRGGSLAVLMVLIAFVGVGVALVVAGSVVGLDVTVRGYSTGGIGRRALQAPVVVSALGAELIATAVLLGWRAGAANNGEDDADVPR